MRCFIYNYLSYEGRSDGCRLPSARGENEITSRQWSRKRETFDQNQLYITDTPTCDVGKRLCLIYLPINLTPSSEVGAL